MEIAVISGKGGTGKSSLSAALATLDEKLVLADCDVDAANLHILFQPVHEEEEIFTGGQKAVIDRDVCTDCGLCIDYCRFDAIAYSGTRVTITETLCDGCMLCSRICPVNAISMVNSEKSRMYAGSFRNGKMVYGRLAPGEENSGKLVNLVRSKAKQMARAENIDTIIIDGPPGIGCPVISSITGVDQVVIVTEPGMTGFHDLKRILELTSSFSLKTWVIINKYDLNESFTARTENYCKERHIHVAGKIPFDPEVTAAMVHCKSITEYAPESAAARSIRHIRKKIFGKYFFPIR